MLKNYTDKIWKGKISEFRLFLKLEKSLSQNTIDAYVNDVRKLAEYSEKVPKEIDLKELENFIYELNSIYISPVSQARIISGIKAFFNFRK